MVAVLAAVGYSHENIAGQLGVSLDVLKRHYAHELEQGAAEVLARIAAGYTRKAIEAVEGDDPRYLRCAELYLRTHGGEGWRDRATLELPPPPEPPPEVPLIRLVPLIALPPPPVTEP